MFTSGKKESLLSNSLMSAKTLEATYVSSLHLRIGEWDSLYRRSKKKIEKHPILKHKKWLVHDREDNTLWEMTRVGVDIERLKQEFGALMLCKHENLLKLREIIKFEGNFIVVTEVPSNKALLLSKFLKRENEDVLQNLSSVKGFKQNELYRSNPENADDGWGESMILYILYEVLKGLGALHSMNIVHNDIRPENVILSVEGFVKISDVSFATVLTKEKPLVEKARGDALYKSPEAVISSQGYDGLKADIWTFGIFTLKVAENRVPHEKIKDSQRVLQNIFRNNPPFLERNVWRKDFKTMNKLCLQHNVSVRPSARKLLKHKIWSKAKSNVDLAKYMEAQFSV